MGKPLRVLLVEDSPLDAELLVLTLKRAGFDPRVERVAGANELRCALTAKTWDVILSDYSMPGFSGLDALSIVQNEGVDIPFIVVSGSLGEDVAVEVIKAGAHDFFAKGNLVRLGASIEREIREADIRRVRVAERKRAEEERERLLHELREAVRVRDVFLSIASHELKTPLTSLKLQLDRLRRDRAAKVATDHIDERLAIIDRQVQRLTALISRLLDIDRFKEGMGIAREPVDLGELVKAFAEESRELASKSGCDLTVSVEKIRAGWDPVHIDTVLTNLLSNAVKFGPHRPVAITLRRDGDVACLSVRDEGIGIAPEDQKRLFKKFERAVSEANYGGFGLGLWIVRQIAMSHGGTAQVESAVGKGATFTVRLPIVEV